MAKVIPPPGTYPPAPEEPPYEAKDTIAFTTKYALLLGGAGATISAIQSTLARQNLGVLGFVTRFGDTTAMAAALGGSYAFAHHMSANLRQKDDAWNTAIGGFFAGATVGARLQSMPKMVGFATGSFIVFGAFEYSGGKLSEWRNAPVETELERKERLRKNRRRNVWETVTELGEGRGVYGPGYKERRRQRILENYGIDVGEATK